MIFITSLILLRIILPTMTDYNKVPQEAHLFDTSCVAPQQHQYQQQQQQQQQHLIENSSSHHSNNNHCKGSYTACAKKCLKDHPSDAFVVRELASDEDCCGNVFQTLLRIYNLLFKCGFKCMLFTLVFFSILTAPFYGCLVGLIEFICQKLRAIIRPIGRLVADLTGAQWTQLSYQLSNINDNLAKNRGHIDV